MNDFDASDLKGKARTLANAITAWLAARNGYAPSGNGCKAYYSPRQWRERGESYGCDSVLILCHDGGALATVCNLDYGNYLAAEEFRKFLHSRGYWVEACTSWYSAVYPRGGVA